MIEGKKKSFTWCIAFLCFVQLMEAFPSFFFFFSRCCWLVLGEQVRFCYYAEADKVLGKSYGMVVLQDFEALTPNLLAKATEACEGGGIVAILLSHLDSLTRLYAMSMDVHSRFRTESHQDVVSRFNERFLLSLARCSAALALDDELNVLPISSSSSSSSLPSPPERDTSALERLSSAAKGAQPDEQLIRACKTSDQARAVASLLDAFRSKFGPVSHSTTNSATSAAFVTAPRGRGKSSAMGMAAAGAVAMGATSVCVSAPALDNLTAFFSFLQKGLEAAGYGKHTEFEAHEEEQGRVDRVDIFSGRKQSVRFLPCDKEERAHQAEVLIVDEAAAIPLNLVERLSRAPEGAFTAFSSTVSGYEGTGRSLSYKLLSWLQRRHGKQLREISLSEPIRYGPNDPVESWLNSLLCLGAQEHLPRLVHALPPPEECELFAVNRDTLFSCHQAAESFLQQTMALYASSHYRNSPDDLQLLSDAPAHRVFVLLPPLAQGESRLPEVLAVLQVALEGAISRQSAKRSLASGSAPHGDMVPWTVSHQFSDPDFPALSGARVVRVAVHPEVQKAGYGSQAVRLLAEYFEGRIAPLSGHDPAEEGFQPEPSASDFRLDSSQGESLHNERPQPRDKLPPLLQPLSERRPERVHWLGAAFGLSDDLVRFWSRLGFEPVYLRQTPTETTGEHTCVMLKELGTGDQEAMGDVTPGWLRLFSNEFRCRLASMLPGPFRHLSPQLVLSMMSSKRGSKDDEKDKDHNAYPSPSSVAKVNGERMTHNDLERLAGYAKGAADHQAIRDLVPALASAHAFGKLPVGLSYAQSAVLMVVGLQQREVRDAAEGLGLPVEQALALHGKGLRKIHQALKQGAEQEAERALASKAPSSGTAPLREGVDEELGEEAKAAMQREQERELGAPSQLKQYAIDTDAQDWESALAAGATESGRISVKRTKPKGESSEGGTGTTPKKRKKGRSKGKRPS